MSCLSRYLHRVLPRGDKLARLRGGQDFFNVMKKFELCFSDAEADVIELALRLGGNDLLERIVRERVLLALPSPKTARVARGGI